MVRAATLPAMMVAVVIVCSPATRLRAQEMRVFSQNPVRTPTPEVETCSEKPSAGRLVSPRLRVRSCVPTAPGAGAALACAPGHSAAADAAGNFLFEPRRRPALAADPFAEVSAYYHASRVLSYLESLGYPREEVFDAPPLDIIVGAQLPRGSGAPERPSISRPQAAFISRRDPEGEVVRQQLGVPGNLVWLGFGAHVNMAYDGDVVIHETLHAVFGDSGTGGWVIGARGARRDGPAIAEALADYFTAVITGDPMIGEYRASAAARDLRGRHAVAFRTGVPHRDGMRLSQALWLARVRLPEGDRVLLDRALLAFARARARRDEQTIRELAATLLDGLSAHPAVAAAVRKAFVARRVLAPVPAVVRVTALGSEIPPDEVFLLPDVEEGSLGPATVQMQVRIPRGVKMLRGSLDVVPVAPSPWAKYGGESVEREVTVVASFGAPVRWDRGKAKTPHALVRTTRAFGFTVPKGATIVYIHVAASDTGLAFRRPVFSFVR